VRRDANPADPTVPPHKAILKLVTGTSGGGVNSATLARALAFDFPHVTAATDRTLQHTGNPFYDLWVNDLSLSGFLTNSDIDAGNFISLLNGQTIDNAARNATSFTSPTWRTRSWIAVPLQMIITLTNLRGIPYVTPLSGGNGDALSETFVDHADFARFAFVYPDTPFVQPRPDEFVLGFGPDRLPQALDWPTFGEFAKGTAAFPLGFPPRQLQRPMEQLRWRVVTLPGDQTGSSPTRVLPRIPDWNAFIPTGQTELPSDYGFLVVDGGATDNEPIELARTALAGMLARNPREPKIANRGVVLVDPFAGQSDLGPAAAAGFTDLPWPIVQSLIQQTRYDTSDLLLAMDDNVYSRFLVTPTLSGVVGEKAIASGGAGAFIGFACRDFTRYDYLLGRANAQKFLQNEFVLDQSNPVFDSWPAALKMNPDYRTVDPRTGEVFLSIIPLMGNARVPESLDAWPKNKLNPESYRDAIEARFDAIVKYEGEGGILDKIAAWVVAHLGQTSVADLVVKAMQSALAEWHLD